jgi:diguanylate cyclase (GGDEF)-like protein
MHPAESDTLEVLVVTEDRAQARQVSRFLNMVGYRARQAAEPQVALAAVEIGRPLVLLLGASVASRANWELCRLLDQRPNGPALFKLLLVDEPDEDQVQEALEAGIDDFLPTPIRYGELLSRLRAAARVLEHDRRSAEQGRVDAVTGLVSGPAFVGQLREQWQHAAGASSRVACVVLDLDYFSRFNQVHGIAGGNTLLKTVVQELNHLRVGSESLGCLGADRFCTMLPGASEAAAFEWAERARQVLAAMKFKLGKSTCQVTASFGVSDAESADSAEQLLDHATAALETAKQSGRNCVARWAEFAAEPLDGMSGGQLFEGTTARHVMTPVSILLQPDEAVARGEELLRQTRLEALGVVDASGKLVGLFKQGLVASDPESNHGHHLVGDAMTTDLRTMRPQDDFASLMAFFNQDPLAIAVVVDEGRPIGLVDCDSLLALAQPIVPRRHTPKSRASESSEYLLVPDLAPEAGSGADSTGAVAGLPDNAK